MLEKETQEANNLIAVLQANTIALSHVGGSPLFPDMF
jgi:hypothetical protein